MFVFSKVEWSPSIWLRQGCGIQNHHEDNVSRRSHPEARKLRERLALCVLRLQTSGFQVAQADGLQRETGKVICTFFFSNRVEKIHNRHINTQQLNHLTRSLLGASSLLELYRNTTRKTFFFFFFIKSDFLTPSHPHNYSTLQKINRPLVAWMRLNVWVACLFLNLCSLTNHILHIPSCGRVSCIYSVIKWTNIQLLTVRGHVSFLFSAFQFLRTTNSNNLWAMCHADRWDGVSSMCCNSAHGQLVACVCVHYYVWYHSLSLFSLWPRRSKSNNVR